ncbi:MAG: hypothetical protein KDD46_03950 [Bdellovibrionales bacterium]|nr:hypothetical protein [Bdellovibrionales bacterium]
MNKYFKIFIFSILILGPAIWMTMSALQQNIVSCDICVSFNGQTKCVKAKGETQQSCQRTAVDNACGVLAGGVQQSIQCSQKMPISESYY